MADAVPLALVSVLLVSAMSLVGSVLLVFGHRQLQYIILALVGFSTGALLGGAMLHLLPEALDHFGRESPAVYMLVLSGIVLSFIVERFIHWHHCHNLYCQQHTSPVGTMILIGDGVHNILDGILIASSYLVSIPLGITTTVAVVLHELPQELGDFAVLLHSGFTKGRALIFNFVSACTAVLGAFLVLGFSGTVHGIEAWIIPIAAGHFFYIAGADLIPELHKEQDMRRSFVQFICMLLGIALMYMLMTEGH